MTVHAKAGENGKLFGKVTSKEIADAVSRQYSVPVSKKKVELSADIKAQGEFTFEVKLHAGVNRIHESDRHRISFANPCNE